jgi:diguanylate cyclase (GGDEF)-like protein
MKKNVIIVSSDPVLINIADRTLKTRYNLIIFNSVQSALDYIYNSLPDLMIIDLTSYEPSTIDLTNNLKNDPMFNNLPVLAIFSGDISMKVLYSISIEDYLRMTEFEKDIAARVDLSIVRSERIVEINPLTRLPGNISINRQLQHRLDQQVSFGMAYADLDYFKPFNDQYGFSRGDEIIKITGRLILNIVKNTESKNSFVGHIGGDDFIFLMDVALIKKACQDIITAFDQIIPTFYDQEDRDRGCIQSLDRQGNMHSFDIITISIGVTDTQNRTFSHYGEITERASEMKKYAKQFRGSCFRFDRRK